MRESCTSGSVRGASSDRRLYSTLLIRRRPYVLAVAQMVGFGPEGRICFIFQWRLTDTLSAISR